MEFLGLDAETVKTAWEALTTNFFQTLAVFTVASWVHGRQVRKEIKNQMGLLVSVLQQDLVAQKEVLGSLGGRVSRIESHLSIKGGK